MISKRPLIALIWTMLIVCSACENDEFPKKYVFHSYKAGNLKAYTKTGEITDEAVMLSFVERSFPVFREVESDPLSYFWPSGYESANWSFEIEIISAIKARIHYSNTSHDYDLIRKNGIVYFQSTTTAMSPGSLVNERLKYSPLIIDSGPWYLGQQQSVYRPCFYIDEKNVELHIPAVTYVECAYVSTGEFLSSQGIENHNNIFDTGYLKKIKNNLNRVDTIVYQNNTVIFRARN